MLQPHWESSAQRMREHPVVLCLQDTTELDFDGKATRGLGPLSYEAQRGMYLHPTYAVTPARVPLGVIDAWMWAREFKDETGERARWAVRERALDRRLRAGGRAGAADAGHAADVCRRPRGRYRRVDAARAIWGSQRTG
jgi:hypothetical protein